MAADRVVRHVFGQLGFSNYLRLMQRSVWWIYIIFGWMLAGGCMEESTEGILQEYCDTEVFRPRCRDNEVVRMETARYGRMKLGRCVEIDLGYVGCSTDVIGHADNRCSGRKSCEIRVPDAEFESTRPCFKELKTYFEASYTCVEVATRDVEECHRFDHLNLTSPSGWISSYVSLETGCGSTEHPWVIQVRPGQRINLTLYDFSFDRAYNNNDITYGAGTEVCQEYALVQGWATDHNTIVCGGRSRKQHVLISDSNIIEIKLTNNNDKYFLVQYEAVGCADLPPPINGWFERKDTGAVVGCYHSNERWHMTCSGTTWIGHVGNCSSPPPGLEVESPHLDLALPIGASVAIIIGAALGVGLVVVVIGLLRFRRSCQTGRGYETPSRETILLREKISPPLEAHQADSGHCSIDTTDTDTTPPPPRIGVVRHQRVVKINGNDYAHIWEAPLPEPSTSANIQAYRTMIRAPIGSEGCTCMYNIKPTVCPLPPREVAAAAAQAAAVAAPCDSVKFSTTGRRIYQKSPTPYEPPRYSTLDRKGLYGNSSSV